MTKWLKRTIPRIALIAVLLVVSLGVILPGAPSVYAAPANCYWVGGTGNWSDSTNHWAIISGGAPGAANLPDATSNVFFDAASFTAPGQIVTTDATANCLAMTWTGATNTPTFSIGARINFYGSLTFIAAMTVTTGNFLIFFGAGAKTITMAGHDFSGCYYCDLRDVTLLDAFSCGTSELAHAVGYLDTGGFTVTCGVFTEGSSIARTLTLGNSTVNCTFWSGGGSPFWHRAGAGADP